MTKEDLVEVLRRAVVVKKDQCRDERDLWLKSKDLIPPHSLGHLRAQIDLCESLIELLATEPHPEVSDLIGRVADGVVRK